MDNLPNCKDIITWWLILFILLFLLVRAFASEAHAEEYRICRFNKEVGLQCFYSLELPKESEINHNCIIFPDKEKNIFKATKGEIFYHTFCEKYIIEKVE
jgi:hypothetical protein